MNRSTIGLLTDADAHTREVAMLANYRRDGIELGQPTRMHFTLQDAIEIGAWEAAAGVCQVCGRENDTHYPDCESIA